MDSKTPIKQLARFYNTSRDRWKDKCKKAKEEIKLLKKQVEYHATKSQSRNETIKELKAENEELKKTLDE